MSRVAVAEIISLRGNIFFTVGTLSFFRGSFVGLVTTKFGMPHRVSDGAKPFRWGNLATYPSDFNMRNQKNQPENTNRLI
ncbi:MAG: hypothetical protein DWH99_15800 [Planctomycetota bacterium]|jgi:hypothetical protein|nr:MAG: hypothetical protein DWH99_15800 [Planctomycetota bacterium]